MIEAWRGMECVAFSTRFTAKTTVRDATHYAVDLQADRVYIRRNDLGGALVADRDAFGWNRVDDPYLDEQLQSEW